MADLVRELRQALIVGGLAGAIVGAFVHNGTGLHPDGIAPSVLQQALARSGRGVLLVPDTLDPEVPEVVPPVPTMRGPGACWSTRNWLLKAMKSNSSPKTSMIRQDRWTILSRSPRLIIG